MVPDSSRELAELMRAYCGGDAAAFRALYAQVGPRIRGYLLRLAGDHALADDLLQATFLRVHRARGSYIEQADPLPWLYAIAHRLFIDETRRRKRQPMALPNDADGLMLVDDSRGAHEGLEQQLEAERAMNALQQLSPEQKQAVVLTKLEGRSMQQAAEIAGVTLAAMKVRAHRGYVALRRAMEASESK